MSLHYKIDVLSALHAAGYNTYRIAQSGLFSSTVMQKFRTGEIVSPANLSKLCYVLNMQPGDILEYIPDDPYEQRFGENPNMYGL